MEGVKGVNSTDAAPAKELDCNTVDTTEHAFFAAEFTMVNFGYSSTFESNELFEEHLTFCPP